MTTPDPSSNICFVLVSTTHAGNIGASARAMKTMGFRNLRLVNPCKFRTQEAHVRASGAGDILEGAEVFSDLAGALSDCTAVYGSSARTRSLEGRVLTARDAADQIAKSNGQSDSGRIAIVFGRERSGLTNEELALCDQRLSIPSNPEFSSLNLGSAVQVIAYELQLTLSDSQANPVSEAGDAAPQAVDNEELERFHLHLEQTLIELQFLNPENPRLLMPRLRRYFIRNRPDTSELSIFRGILSAAQKAARR